MSWRLAVGLHLGRGGAVAWTPAALGDLVFWYDPNAEGYTADQAVASLTDRSGNGLDLSQGTGTARMTAKVGLQNGKTMVRGDGGDSIQRASVDLSAYTALTIMGVAGGIDLTTNRTLIAFGVVGTNAGSFEIRVDGTNGRVRATAHGNVGSSTWLVTAGVGSGYHVIEATMDFGAASGSEVTAWMDGVSTGSASASAENTGAFSSALTLSLGQRPPNTAGIVGDLGEWFMVGRVLTPDERAVARAQLKAKWGTA